MCMPLCSHVRGAQSVVCAQPGAKTAEDLVDVLVCVSDGEKRNTDLVEHIVPHEEGEKCKQEAPLVLLGGVVQLEEQDRRELALFRVRVADDTPEHLDGDIVALAHVPGE